MDIIDNTATEVGTYTFNIRNCQAEREIEQEKREIEQGKRAQRR